MSVPPLLAILLSCVAVYHAAPPDWRPRVLLLGSYGFYAWFAASFLPLLIVVTLFAYWVGARAAGPSEGKSLLVGVSLLVAALLFVRLVFPAGNLLVEPIAAVGVSFYVLQAVSYVVDRARGVDDEPARFLDVAVYLAYFPKLLCGPIERASDFCRQLRFPLLVDNDCLARAVGLLVLGGLRKLVIADPLRTHLPWHAFTDPTQLGSGTLLLTSVLFLFVIYCDFAAYSDLARGVSLLFGIELRANFRQPMFAAGPSDLWNRWHASLSHWLRDYVYLPMSRSILRRDLRVGNAANVFAPPVVTMICSGLWHGGSASLLLWGLLHGLLLALERVWVLRPGQSGSAWRRPIFLVLFWSVAILTLPLFFLDLPTAVAYMEHSIFGTPGWSGVAWTALPLVGLSLALDRMQHRSGELFFLSWPRFGRAAGLAVAALLCFLFAHTHVVLPFIYQGF